MCQLIGDDSGINTLESISRSHDLAEFLFALHPSRPGFGEPQLADDAPVGNAGLERCGVDRFRGLQVRLGDRRNGNRTAVRAARRKSVRVSGIEAPGAISRRAVFLSSP